MAALKGGSLAGESDWRGDFVRKYDWRFVERMPLGHGLKDKPAPFPGEYPTWISLRVQVHGKHPFLYVGKPSKGIIVELQYALDRTKGLGGLYINEFDRKSKVAYGSFPIPNMYDRDGHGLIFPFRAYSPELMRFYHPWGSMNNILPFGRECHRKSIKLGDKTVRVYSPREPLSLAEHIEPYRAWVEKTCPTKPLKIEELPFDDPRLRAMRLGRKYQ